MSLLRFYIPPLQIFNYLCTSITDSMTKRTLLAAVAALAALAASAQMKAGEKYFGPRLGYVSENRSVVAGLTFQTSVTDHIRLAPEIGCAFRNHGEDALLIDFNVHVPFGMSRSGKVDLYPLAGLAFNSWSLHGMKNEEGDDVTNHVNRLGLNLGAGFDFRITGSLKMNFEAKYTLVKKYSAAYVTVGLGYMF